MTPKGKSIVNEALKSCGARITTPIDTGQNVRYVKLVTHGEPEVPLNVLDSEGLLLRAEDTGDEDARRVAMHAGRPLLKLHAMACEPQIEWTAWIMEDTAAERPEDSASRSASGEAQAGDRVSARPLPVTLGGAYDVYPPGHPSRTGQKIV